MNRRRPAAPARLLPRPLVLAAGLLSALACGPRAHIPSRPTPEMAAALPGAAAPDADDALRARRLAPVLYLHRDEWFRLERVVAVVHPERRLIAYHLLWRDDAHGSWIPFTVPTDQELIWVGFDSTEAPIDVWTFWHGTILHTSWPRTGVAIDVQWGKHGSLPQNTFYEDLPGSKKLNSFWLFTWLGLPDLWLGRLTRKGPLCFCHGFARYRQFTTPLSLASRLDAIVVTSEPDEALKRVFGRKYSRKRPWP